jgi:hypothetical protein
MWGTSPEMEELIKTVTVVSSIGAGIKEHRFELEVSQRPIHHFRAVVTLPAQYGSPVAGQTNAIEKVIIYIVSETLLDMAKENAACAQTPAPRVKNQCCVLS